MRKRSNLASVPMLIASAAFGALWLLLRAQPRSPEFVRAVELSTLFVGTAAFSAVALVPDLTASPDMIARSAVTYLLLFGVADDRGLVTSDVGTCPRFRARLPARTLPAQPLNPA